MVWGFFKKLVIADRLALVTAYVLAARPKMPGWLAMGGTVCYAVRLYADFSGGVDIIRGISRMVGVELPENFRRPFFAASVADYWRRWHITLGAWFRSCLLYPLAAGRPGVWLGKAAGKLFGTKTGRRIPAAAMEAARPSAVGDTSRRMPVPIPFLPPPRTKWLRLE